MWTAARFLKPFGSHNFHNLNFNHKPSAGEAVWIKYRGLKWEASCISWQEKNEDVMREFKELEKLTNMVNAWKFYEKMWPPTEGFKFGAYSRCRKQGSNLIWPLLGAYLVYGVSTSPACWMARKTLKSAPETPTGCDGKSVPLTNNDKAMITRWKKQ